MEKRIQTLPTEHRKIARKTLNSAEAPRACQGASEKGGKRWKNGEEKGGIMATKAKTRIECADYNITLKSLDCDFNEFMQKFYDNGIECIGIKHDLPNDGVPHCHIVTIPYLKKDDFKNIFGITNFFVAPIISTIPEVIAYLLHRSEFYDGYGFTRYDFSALKTNIDLKQYRNDILRHGINFN